VKAWLGVVQTALHQWMAALSVALPRITMEFGLAICTNKCDKVVRN
jgi:hypothetical protein